jgi:hypothetical protein
MNFQKICVVLLGMATFGMGTAAANEQRVIGHINGKPIYGASAPARRVAVGGSHGTVRVAATVSAPRVRVGSVRSYHGPVSSHVGYQNGGYGWANGGYAEYGYGNGYGYGPGNGFGQNCYPGGYGWSRPHCGFAPQPFQAAASRGYSWIPRYGSTTAVPKYTR